MVSLNDLKILDILAEQIIELNDIEKDWENVSKAVKEIAAEIIGKIKREKYEVNEAIKCLKKMEVTRIGQVPAELIKYGGKEMQQLLLRLHQKIWKDELKQKLERSI
ncbi:Transposon TX1 uncharacterized protein [Aphis craccivora]|uniref:Transposon TX1 uncharacterized protein n=1 Tax=Aphis craccivora TaxID=307492 RepID=A0A6G0XZP5_APHCR|nr:Transposon TX1 uncharacterized protein [Aphis craccivora]